MLLSEGNLLVSIPFAFTVHKVEAYENKKGILSCMNYKQYQWHICSDLKVVSILMWLQKSCTKFCCFLCEWGSRAKSVHYSKKNWPLPTLHTHGTKNVAHQFLVDRCKVLLPTLHVNRLAPELFFLILAHPVYKMWIIQEPNKLALWKKLHFEEKKNGEYGAC